MRLLLPRSAPKTISRNMTIKVLASGSKGNSYHISDGVSAVLLDAGISLKQIRVGIGFTLSAVSGAFITHRHNDHAKAVCDLLNTGVDVYAHRDVFEAKKACGRHCKPISDGIVEGRARDWITCGSFRVLPFSCHHDVPNLGFYIHSNVTGENLLYFTDTYYIEPVFPDLHYIMAECNYDPDAINQSIRDGRIPISLKARLVKSHMGIDTFIDLLKANDLSKVKQIYLLHLSDNNSREAEFKAKVQAVTGCEVYVC